MSSKENGQLVNDVIGNETTNVIDRQSFNATDGLVHLWHGLNLPSSALKKVKLPGEGFGLPSSFKVADLAQSSIALSALLAALLLSIRTQSDIPAVVVPRQHAAIEFKSERLYSLDGKPAPNPWGPIGGLHKTSDGYVRLHDSFPHHREGAKTLLGLDKNADRKMVAEKITNWKSMDLETSAFDEKLVISALRSYKEWDSLPQSRAISDFPITIRKIRDGPPKLALGFSKSYDKCLRGLRVLEMSRVIAAPLAGKTLAVHGADVLWITSPNLPDLPTIDRDFGRGKRTGHVDINDRQQKETLLTLLKDADVFIQGFRPTSLASKGLEPLQVADNSNGGIVIGNMSAYGPDGPWAERRGFDSLVQTCSGMNVSEAEHYGQGEAARPTPCQALDHAGGYFLASGIMAALYKQATEGGSYVADVSLARVMKYLRSLGQYPDDSGFKCRDYQSFEDVPEQYMETRSSGFGSFTAVRHSAEIEGVQVGWDIMPKPLGSDELRWL